MCIYSPLIAIQEQRTLNEVEEEGEFPALDLHQLDGGVRAETQEEVSHHPHIAALSVRQ